MSASSQKETCAFAFEASLLVGQAQQTFCLKKTRFVARHHCGADCDRWYLRHELQEHPGVAMGIWLFHHHWRGPDCLRDIILGDSGGSDGCELEFIDQVKV